MTLPTRHETFSALIEHLRLAQEASATLGHLHNANVAEGILLSGSSSKERAMALGWLTVSEALKIMQKKVIQLAQGRNQ